MLYAAHIRADESGEKQVQTVQKHCRHCAQYARLAAPPGMEQCAYLAGLLHDMGKCTGAFSRYISAAASGEAVCRGSVNHTFAGVHFLMARWHGAEQSFRDLTAELLAFVTGAHHGQFDCVSPDGADGFRHRVTQEGIGYEEARAGFLSGCAAEKELDQLFDEATAEVEAKIEAFQAIAQSQAEMLFLASMLARQLLSAVLEGDRRDTAEFFRGIPYSGEADPPPDWKTLLDAMEERLKRLPAQGEINAARQSISDQCRRSASGGAGIYRLNVPTGGGKTLASLRFALASAAEAHKKRILFVIPLLSVLEQNAKVVHDYLNADELILEHHSNVVLEPDMTENGELSPQELLMESWKAPVIITTLVQLLDTLFAGKTSCIRRMNALSRSVIIIDEVQSVPLSLLSEFNMAMNYLAGVCGATVVLCSATQPCLEKAQHPLRYAAQPELVPYDEAVWRSFRRTEIIDRRKPGGYPAEELAAFAAACCAEYGSVLLVCNTKAETRALFLAAAQLQQQECLHLSTSMCMQHRIRTIRQIHDRLAQHRQLLCVSTQLIECGVDLSFGCVIRVSAGMDNIVQSAGRCNRNGEHARPCPVFVVNLQGEKLNRLPEIYRAQQAAEALMLLYQRDAASFDNDLTGERSISTYYRLLFQEMKQGAQDYPLPELQTSLFDLLAENNQSRARCPGCRYLLAQSFRTAGELFHVFSSETTDVLVPYGDGAGLIEQLGSGRALHDLEFRKELLRQAGKYSVSLFAYEVEKLRQAGGIYAVCDNTVLALSAAFYSEELGVDTESGGISFTAI